MMADAELENLLKAGLLKREAFSQSEYDATLRNACEQMQDLETDGLSPSTRFLLAYGAAYKFSLAALRRHGYRPTNRYIVFQCLTHTLAADQLIVRTLGRAHDVRNGFEYEASEEITADLVTETIRCAHWLSVQLA